MHFNANAANAQPKGCCFSQLLAGVELRHVAAVNRRAGWAKQQPDLTSSVGVSKYRMMLVREAAPACCFALLLFHCGGDQTDVADPVTELSLVTFNAALGVGLAPYPEQRLAAIQRDLASVGADVICLQEVWQPENIEQLTEALAREFPYAHRSVQAVGGSAGGTACTAAEASLLSTCIAESCAEVEGNALPLCAIANCAPAFTEVSTSCQQCIAANQAATDVQNLTTICSASDGAAAAYRDQTGLLILSRLPLEELDYVAFESSLGDRGALSARLQTDFSGSVDIYCTHLAASLREVPYTGAYGSWQGERLRQIDQFLEHVSATRAPSGAAALLGDMNCGPGTPLASAASPDAFERFVTADFSDPYVEGDGRCTFCSNNPLNGLVSDAEEGALIDHVLVSGFVDTVSSSAARIFDDTIDIQAEGSAVQTARSDHYGVRVAISGVLSGSMGP